MSWPRPYAIPAAEWLLRICVLAYCAAQFALVFGKRQTRIGNYLFLELELPYGSAVYIEKIAVSIFLAAGVLTLLRPMWPVLALIAAYTFAEPLAGYLQGGYRYSDWSPLTQAARWMTPLALLAMTAMPRAAALGPWRMPAASALLRIGIALVFITHGLFALWAHPAFVDLIIGTVRNFFGAPMTEATARWLLWIIGVVDICVALALLIYPVPLGVPRRVWADPCRVCPIRRIIVPSLLGWMAFWGLVTALSRMTAQGMPRGLGEYPELLVRASHYLGPIALMLLLLHAPGMACRRSRQSRVRSAVPPAAPPREPRPGPRAEAT